MRSVRRVVVFMVGSKWRQPLRPPRFTSYMAASAGCSSASADSPSVGDYAMPLLAETCGATAPRRLHGGVDALRQRQAVRQICEGIVGGEMAQLGAGSLERLREGAALQLELRIEHRQD